MQLVDGSALEIAARFGTAAGLGLVLGLEREHSQKDDLSFAGARTFSFITLLGALTAYLEVEYALPAMVAVGFLGVVALVTVSYAYSFRAGQVGATTEVSGLFAFLIGCLCGWGELALAAGVGVAGLVLLSIKVSPPLSTQA